MMLQRFRSALRDDNTSRHPLWVVVSFLMVCVIFLGHRAVVENNSATRQKTSFGTIAQCEYPRTWKYKLAVTTHFQLAMSNTRVSTKLNQMRDSATFWWFITTSQDPNVSALEEFSDQSRKDKRFVCILLLMLASNALPFAFGTGRPTRVLMTKRPPAKPPFVAKVVKPAVRAAPTDRGDNGYGINAGGVRVPVGGFECGSAVICVGQWAFQSAGC